MAARYAVATGNWTGAIWAATAGGAAGSAAVPTSADDATVNKNVGVTLDATTLACNTLALSVGTTGADVGGKILASTTANCKLTVERGITSSGATGSGGAYSSTVQLDVSAAPGFTCEIVTNNANASGAGWPNAFSGNFSLKGAPRKRHTVLVGAITAGATSAVVLDATGWQIGDRIVFASTEAYANPPHVDVVTLTSVNTGTGAIGWTGGITYGHATACPAGNFSSNLVFRPGTAGGVCALRLNSAAGAMNVDGEITHTEFRQCMATSSFPGSILNWGLGDTNGIKCSDNAFWDHNLVALYLNHTVKPTERKRNIFYSTQTSAAAAKALSGFYGSTTSPFDPGSDEDYVVFRGVAGLNPVFPGQRQIGHQISGCVGTTNNSDGGLILNTVGQVAENCKVWGNNAGYFSRSGGDLIGCAFGDQVFAGTNNTAGATIGPGVHNFTDTLMQSGSGAISGIAEGLTTGVLNLFNKNADVAVQEAYQQHSNTVPVIQRDAAPPAGGRSTSAILMTCNSTTLPVEKSFQILAKAGETVRIIGYVRKSGTPAYGAATLPKITVSGLGITPVVATMSAGTAADAWEKLTLDATNSGASDGLLTVTLTAQSATAGAKAWFAGIPVAPFVSRCRHYGYLFDESSPVRTANITTSANEATAAAYTGIAITWGASSSSISITVNSTLQKLYDYHQAQAVLNVGSALALAGAGVAGSPALFAAGDITVADGVTLNGNGSLSMGGFTILATEFSSGIDYTYTGGTWGQLSNSPTFAGGTLNLGAAATYAFGTTGNIIISMTPAVPSTYVMEAVSSTGQLDLRNTTAHAITVQLPSGTDYTTANNTGGTITVTLPVVTADISITGMPNAGAVPTRLQIINQTALTAAAWQGNTLYAAGAMRRRTAGIGTENTAGLYLRCTTGGTSGAVEPTWNTTPGGTTADGTAVWTTYKVLFYDADPASTSYATTYVDGKEFLAGETAEIRFSEMNGATTFKGYDTTAIVAASGFSVAVNEEANSVFATIGIDGSTQESTFSPNYANDRLLLDSNTNFSGVGAYSYYCYLLTTSEGMYNFWGGVTALDVANFRINTAILDLYFDETAGFVRQTDAVRWFRDDGLRPALDPTTGGAGIEINWQVPVSVVTAGSGLNPTQDAHLMSLTNAAGILAAATAAGGIHADMRKTNGEQIIGNGTEANKFRSHLVA